MKRIYLIRHAKSSWKDTDTDDFDRDLNKRGKKDAPMMGKRLKKLGIKPDFVLCSPAKRAKKTAQKICKELDFGCKDIAYDGSLYESSVQDYMDAIKKIDENKKEVFVVGHNMTLTYLAESLSGVIIGNMPTCSVVCVEFDGYFAELEEKSANMVFFDFPKSVQKA